MQVCAGEETETGRPLTLPRLSAARVAAVIAGCPLKRRAIRAQRRNGCSLFPVFVTFLFLSRHLRARRVQTHRQRLSPRLHMRFVANALLIVTLIAAAPAFAEEPPARVGRVAFHEKGETAWSKASLNYPVAAGGAFWTDPKSRAELRIGSRSIAMSGNTELNIAKLDQQVMQLAVPQGRIDLRGRQLLEGESIEVD